MKIKFAFLIIFLSGLLMGEAVKADAPASQVTNQNIGVFGDSLGDGVWSGLYNTSKKHPDNKLFRRTKVGTGLTRRDFADWMKEFSAQLDGDNINVAVVMFGANDEQGIRDENRKGYLFKSEGWKRTYSARIDAVFAELEKRKVTVIWVGLPIMRTKEMNDGAAFLNSLYAEKVKSHNGIFVSLADDFKGADGEFSTHYTDAKGKSHLIRSEDGVHFSGYGYELIADKVYKTLSDNKTAPAATPAAQTAPTATPAQPVPADASR